MAGKRADTRDEHFRQAFCVGIDRPERAVLTEERRALLDFVQTKVNGEIAYRPTVTWDPLVAEGDCKTYASRKAQAMLERGWPPGALRIATAFIGSGPLKHQYHTVVLADTDRGTFVLDNRYPTVRPLGELSYVWMTAQAAGDRRWVRLPEDADRVAQAIAANQQGLGLQLTARR